MSALLRIKPTRKEILSLISRALREKREREIAGLQEQVNKINAALAKRKELYNKKCEEITAKLPSTSKQLTALREHAKELGLVETSRQNTRYPDDGESYQELLFTFKAEVSLRTDPKKLPKAPTLTESENEKLKTLNEQIKKLQRSHIDESCIVAHLVEDNEELLQEVQSVADKISISLQQGTAKLLEGTVE